MQVEAGANSLVISSVIWSELDKPQIDPKIRRLEAYDGQQLTGLGSLACDTEWKRIKSRQQQLAIAQSHEIWPTRESNTIPRRHQHSVLWKYLQSKDAKRMWNSYQDPSWCSARQERYLFFYESVSIRNLRRWYDRESWSCCNLLGHQCVSRVLSLSVDLKSHINGKVMDEFHPLPYMETILDA